MITNPNKFIQSILKNGRHFVVLILSICVAVSTLANPIHPRKKAVLKKRWVGTWGTARQLVEPNNMPPQPGLSNNTLRQVVCVSIGGKTLRLKLSNEFGQNPSI
jgi:hypothetical protein